MSFFDGETTHPMDDKGRVSLPARHRKMLPDELVLVPSYNEEFRSLSVFTEDAFEKWVDSLIEKMGGLSEDSAESRHIERELFSKVRRVTIDPAGRILIPSELRQEACLGKTVKIVGVRRRIEIWNEELLKKSREAYSYAEIIKNDKKPQALS